MDRMAAQRMYGVARTELADTEAKLADLNRHRSGLRKVIEGLEEVYPDLAHESWNEPPKEMPEQQPEIDGRDPEATQEGLDETPEVTPQPPTAEPSRANGYPLRGKQAVIAVLSEQPSRWFTTREVLAAMNDRGWTPPSRTQGRALRAVTNAIGRATEDGHVERMSIDNRTMKYRYRSLGQAAEVIPDVT